MTANNWLPNDISRCSNDNCTRRVDCHRWLDDLPFGDNTYPVAEFRPDASGNCNFFIEYKLPDAGGKKRKPQGMQKQCETRDCGANEGSVWKERKTP